MHPLRNLQRQQVSGGKGKEKFTVDGKALASILELGESCSLRKGSPKEVSTLVLKKLGFSLQSREPRKQMSQYMLHNL